MKLLLNSLLFYFTLISSFDLLFCSAKAENSAVILMYHRFGETNYPSTNIRLKQFDAHIKELLNGGYTVLPVKKIILAIQKGVSLPKKTIGITIDDGYRTVYTEAWPRLKKAGLPFTVFIATGSINNGSPTNMNWDQIRELKNSGVEIGAHTLSHNHMPATDPYKNAAELNNSTAKLMAETGSIPEMFAYPFGEASLNNIKLVRQKGFKIAFGQHSGVVNPSTNFNYIPRFSLNEKYGGLDRLKLILNALPLPVKDLTPVNPLVDQNNPPDFGFTVKSSIKNLHQLSCFSSAGGRVRIEQLGWRIEVRMSQAFPKGRTRINCTLPAPNNKWRWLGALFIVPK
jgi:peptidoglycan/xylan/chitin deacetylase (PgdA/CDA1 family)